MFHDRKFAKSDEDIYKVLEQANEEELQEFAKLLRKKWSCKLPEEPEAWQLAAEFQLMGGHTFVNISRGRGVAYKEILSDVAGWVLKKPEKEKFERAKTIEKKEIIVLESILENALEKMSDEQRDEFWKEIQKEVDKQGYTSLVRGSKSPAALLVIQGIRYIIARLVVQAALKKAGLTVLVKIIGGKWVALLAGPIGMAIMALWVTVDFAGPAYSATVPGVMLITAMRARQKSEVAIEQLRMASLEADQKVKEVIDG